MDPAATAFLVAALGGLGAFTGKFVLDTIADARKQRDDANGRTDRAIAAGHENAAAVEKLTATLERANQLAKSK